MGYACPVCGAPQIDAGHLANHLAFTALLGDDDHEDWLDEHAPGWGAAGESALADRVVDHAPEREFPQVFEDTVGDAGHDDPGERSGALFEADPDAGGRSPDRVADPDPAPDSDVADVLREARALTERRRAGVDPPPAGDPEEEGADAETDADDGGRADGEDARSAAAADDEPSPEGGADPGRDRDRDEAADGNG